MSTIVKAKYSSRFLMAALLGVAVMNVSSFMSVPMSERSLASLGDSDESEVSDESDDFEISEDSRGDVSNGGDCDLEKLLAKDAAAASGNNLVSECALSYQKDNEELLGGTASVQRISQKSLRVTLEATECTGCKPTTFKISATRDIESINARIEREFKKKARQILAAENKEARRKWEVKYCIRAPKDGDDGYEDYQESLLMSDESSMDESEDDIDGPATRTRRSNKKGGRKFSAGQRRQCLVGKLAREEFSQDVATKIYTKKIKPEIESLIQNGQGTEAQSVLAQLCGADASFVQQVNSMSNPAKAKDAINKQCDSAAGNSFVKTSAADMFNYAVIDGRMGAIEQQLSTMDPNDPQRWALQRQLGTLGQFGGAMMANRINVVHRQMYKNTSPELSAQGNTLLADLSRWQTALAEDLRVAVEQQNQTVNGGQNQNSSLPNNQIENRQGGRGGDGGGTAGGIMMPRSGQPVGQNNNGGNAVNGNSYLEGVPTIPMQNRGGNGGQIQNSQFQQQPPQFYNPNQPNGQSPYINGNGQQGQQFPPLGRPQQQQNTLFSPVGNPVGCTPVPGAPQLPGYCGVPKSSLI